MTTIIKPLLRSDLFSGTQIFWFSQKASNLICMTSGKKPYEKKKRNICWHSLPYGKSFVNATITYCRFCLFCRKYPSIYPLQYVIVVVDWADDYKVVSALLQIEHLWVEWDQDVYKYLVASHQLQPHYKPSSLIIKQVIIFTILFVQCFNMMQHPMCRTVCFGLLVATQSVSSLQEVAILFMFCFFFWLNLSCMWIAVPKGD